MRAWSAGLAWAACLAAASAGAEPPCPSVRSLLERAGRYLESLEPQLGELTGDESYTQYSYWSASASPTRERRLQSEVAWVVTDDPMVWAFYRDVKAVNGELIGDRKARQEALFPEGHSPSDKERALRILDESARYNLGLKRTVNTPTLAATFLHPRNQMRLTFEAAGAYRKRGVRACRVRYEEHERPTLIANPDGDDVQSSGSFWIEPESGAVVETTLELRARGHDPVRIDTTYRHEPAFAAWLPAEMKESYGSKAPRARGERVEAVARYAAWRRAHVEIEVIIPRP